MGAIAGWVAGRNAPDESAMLPALQALSHRGAARGAFEPSLLAFESESGHRVALGEAAYDDEAGIAASLDGPIANRDELKKFLLLRGYRFTDGSAVEVLLRAYEHWDKDVVHHLRGAFAFALWDTNKERLMLARDRVGEKPLYLAEQGGLRFASQLGALTRLPGMSAQADPAAVRDYLAWRYVPGPRTLVSGARKLAPGSYALWQFGRLREVRYWNLPDGKPAIEDRGANPVEAFTRKLDEAVQMRLPAGVLLSGGLDSAVLVALAARHGEKVKTYSAGFADDRASELPRAAQVAKRFGTEHHEIVLSPRDVIARLPQAVASRDAPVSRPGDVALHFIASEAARSSSAVLTGEGCDEILGGYRRYVAERYHLTRTVPTLLLLVKRNPWLSPASRDQADARGSSLRRALYADQASWLPDNVLERADRMTMAASLEARAPFLDHRLVEFVSTLPDDLRVRGLATKWILRQAAKPLLEGLTPRKAGWRVPMGAWLRGDLREFMVEHLRAAGSITRDYCEARVLDRVIDEHLAGKHDHETLLWTLLNLEIWHRTVLRG